MLVLFLLLATIVPLLAAIDLDTCAVVVVGGSTAALAAALAAARDSPTVQVCLFEPTDWPGGQVRYQRNQLSTANPPLPTCIFNL